jgi:hypothetical protein
MADRESPWETSPRPLQLPRLISRAFIPPCILKKLKDCLSRTSHLLRDRNPRRTLLIDADAILVPVARVSKLSWRTAKTTLVGEHRRTLHQPRATQP